MSINVLMIRNLRKNIRNYYLYVFALVFSVALYFAFVTLQYDPRWMSWKALSKGRSNHGCLDFTSRNCLYFPVIC